MILNFNVALVIHTMTEANLTSRSIRMRRRRRAS